MIVYSGNRAEEFQNGKIRFLSEARNMARFNTHPNIVNVNEFFEENNTAYIAMEFLEGISYKEFIKANGGRVDVGVAVSVVLSVLDALKEIHKIKIIHRDVSPDNIFMIPAEDGSFRVKLIDFGAARFSSGEEEKTLSIILKPGYAPPEQYRSKSKQGPWTDIYAVGAVLYRSITGKMPEESVNRMVEDHLEQPSALVPNLPQYLNDSIMRAMALNQELRFQNVDQFREAIQQKTKVLSVGSELKRRKTMRGLSVAAICVVLLGAAVACQQVYTRRQNALYDMKAEITVRMPDTNGQKEAEITAAGKLGTGNGESRQITLDDSSEMLSRMLAEYQGRFTGVTVTPEAAGDLSEYEKQLETQAKAGALPAVFSTSHVTVEDEDMLRKLGALETTYETISAKDYYFMETPEFQDYFVTKGLKKQIPASFRAPVLYINTYLIPEDQIPKDVTSLDQLKDMDGKSSYCVSAQVRGMYRAAFGAAETTDGFARAKAGEMGYEPFLKREAAYYLGTTDDYEAVRASLGGIYKMVVLESLQKEGKVKGQFTHLWSIDGSLTEDARTAADSLVYYLMSETAQDIFNLQSGNGLSVNKKMLETYVDGNDEFKAVARELDHLQMEYGEEFGA